MAVQEACVKRVQHGVDEERSLLRSGGQSTTDQARVRDGKPPGLTLRDPLEAVLRDLVSTANLA